MVLALMWCPALAAFISSIIMLKSSGEKVRLKSVLNLCGFKKCKWRYIFMGLLIPLIYILVPYLLYWTIFPGTFTTYTTNPLGFILSIFISIVVGTVISLVSAIGEEIGWRGFMLPKLTAHLGLKKALVISGLFWCFWHFPLIIFGDYMEGTPLWYNLTAFVACIFPVAIIFGILALESGSVWPAALLHAAHNNYDQSIFGLMATGDNKMYFVSETGVFTIICVWTLAIIMVVRYTKKVKSA